MKSFKVLWIEDNANNDLYHLTSPVYIDGRYHLDIANNVTEANNYLNNWEYDVIIVDIRLPPGKDPEWQELQSNLCQENSANSNRLGLEFLKYIFERDTNSDSIKISNNLLPEKYGVFTVERKEELYPHLERINLARIKYKRKSAIMPHTALLDFITEVSENEMEEV